MLSFCRNSPQVGEKGILKTLPEERKKFLKETKLVNRWWSATLNIKIG